MRIYLLLLTLCCGLAAEAKTDTVKLYFSQVLQLVRENHPLAKQAALLPKQGESYVRYNRGAFDPKVYFQQRDKTFKAQQYYSETSAALTVPTWYGIDVKAGYENNTGLFLSPDMVTPGNGLSFVGVDVPLMRNVVTDARRTQLRQAQLYQSQTMAMKNQLLNELTASVIHDFAGWYFAWKEQQTCTQAVALLTDRMNAIRAEFIAGGKAATDTIETYAQRGLFLLMLQETRVKETKTRLLLGAHLWNADQQPLEPVQGTVPDIAGIEFLDSMMRSYPDSAVAGNIQELQPQLLSMGLYVQKNKLEANFRKQQLLPEIYLKYQALAPGYLDFSNSGTFAQNNRFGIGFSSSLFLRKERGDYQMAKLAWQESQLKLQQKTRDNVQKVGGLYQQTKAYSNMSKDFETISGLYYQLYENEKTRFTSGDATVFMVNMRETKWMETRLKLLEYQQKRIISLSDYLEQVGVLWQSLQ